MTCGAVYFDQHRHAAQRGYGYVAVSRFRTQARCHLYGKLRATDFLPVGPEQEDEQLYRDVESETDSESDYRDSNASDGGVSWIQHSEQDTEDESVSRNQASDTDTEQESVSRDQILSDDDVSEVPPEKKRRNYDLDVSD